MPLKLTGKQTLMLRPIKLAVTGKSAFICLSVLLFTSCRVLKPIDKKYTPEMVFVKGGEFDLGDFYDGDNTDALPVHTVIVNDFQIGKYEVTYAQYDYYTKVKQLPPIESNLPERGSRAAAFVTWDQAEEFCKFHGMRLPTEIEWEYAARSGGLEELFSGTSNPDSLRYYAVTDEEDLKGSAAVGQRKPNKLGIYDMSGNVFEWVGDFYQIYSIPDSLHKGNEDDIRIFRGGSFREPVFTNRTYWRVGTLRDVPAVDVGFRCAGEG